MKEEKRSVRSSGCGLGTTLCCPEPILLHPLGLRQRLGSIYDRVWLEEQQMKASAAAAILCAYYYTSKAGEEAVKAVEADWPQTHIYSVYSSLHNIYI